jgi:hypothetical protein
MTAPTMTATMGMLMFPSVHGPMALVIQYQGARHVVRWPLQPGIRCSVAIGLTEAIASGLMESTPRLLLPDGTEFDIGFEAEGGTNQFSA